MARPANPAITIVAVVGSGTVESFNASKFNDKAWLKPLLAWRFRLSDTVKLLDVGEKEFAALVIV
jgi:hypothetical protein